MTYSKLYHLAKTEPVMVAHDMEVEDGRNAV
jgi:hypothetical protein